MKILLVDDELQLRNYLRTLVDWAGLGYTLLEAENGKAAIEIMKKTPVNLLMLDISMPVMNGFEVLEWIRQEDYPCVTAILTSRDEIRYAQQALRLGCSDYIIKSDITAEYILDLAGRMQKHLSRELKEQKQRVAMEIAFKRQAMAEIRGAVNFWLKNSKESKLDISDYFEEKLGFSDTNSRYILLRVAISDYAGAVSRYTGSNIAEFSVVFDGVLSELLAGYDYFYTECDAGEFLIFLRFDLKCAVHQLLGKAQQLAGNIDSQLTGLLGINSHIVYTLPYTGVASSVDKYILMSGLRDYSFWNPPRELLCLEDFTFDDAVCADELAAFDSRFALALQSRSLVSIESCYNAMVGKIVESHYAVTPSAFISVCEAAVRLFLRAQQDDAAHLRTSAPSDSMSFKTQLLEQILPYCISEEDQGKTLLVKKAVLLIQQNYKQDIGLEWLAGKLFVNASYLSRVFSAETGHPVTYFINLHRIEQAKRLIRSTNIKLCDAAEQVGFSSSVVFSSTFKKIAGETPTAYRNRNV